jgi:hypothetical protein
MAGLSKNAFAMTAKCSRTGGTFGITVDKVGGAYQLMWAFKINPDVAKREGFEATAVRGRVEFHSDYPGCPYCEEKQFYVCGSCQRIACYHGESTVECPHCGTVTTVECVEELDLKGGSY